VVDLETAGQHEAAKLIALPLEIDRRRLVRRGPGAQSEDRIGAGVPEVELGHHVPPCLRLGLDRAAPADRGRGITAPEHGDPGGRRRDEGRDPHSRLPSASPH
jgi:hypothetical protein